MVAPDLAVGVISLLRRSLGEPHPQSTGTLSVQAAPVKPKPPLWQENRGLAGASRIQRQSGSGVAVPDRDALPHLSAYLSRTKFKIRAENGHKSS